MDNEIRECARKNEFEPLIQETLDGVISTDNRKKLEKHLGECQACLREYSLYEKVDELLQATHRATIRMPSRYSYPHFVFKTDAEFALEMRRVFLAAAIFLLALAFASIHYIYSPVPLTSGGNRQNTAIIKKQPAPPFLSARSVTVLRGTVDVLRTGTETRTVAAGESYPLQPGDIIRTSSDGLARLDYLRNSVVEVSSAASLSLTEGGLNLAGGKIRVSMEELHRFSKKTDGKAPFTIITPHANVEIVGTIFTVEVSSTGTAVKVEKGKVRVFNNRGESYLEAGRACTVNPDSAPVPSGGPPVIIQPSEIPSEVDNDSKIISDTRPSSGQETCLNRIENQEVETDTGETGTGETNTTTTENFIYEHLNEINRKKGTQ